MIYTKLVNKENLWKEKDLTKINLVEIIDINENKRKIEEKTKEAYDELKNYLKQKNIEIGITEGYRTVEEQINLRNALLKEKGLSYIENFVALPYE